MRRAHLWLVAAAAIVPRVVVLCYERDKILSELATLHELIAKLKNEARVL